VSVEALTARLEAAIEAGDIPAALYLIDRLSPTARAAFAERLISQARGTTRRFSAPRVRRLRGV
jgi:hypothetical protein